MSRVPCSAIEYKAPKIFGVETSSHKEKCFQLTQSISANAESNVGRGSPNKCRSSVRPSDGLSLECRCIKTLTEISQRTAPCQSNPRRNNRLCCALRCSVIEIDVLVRPVFWWKSESHVFSPLIEAGRAPSLGT